MNTPTHSEVALRAYQIWQDQGCPIGNDQEIWFEAERQLNHGIAFSDRQFGMSDLLLERLQSETAAESIAAYQGGAAIVLTERTNKAVVQQKKPVRDLKQPAKSNPGNGRLATETKTQFAKSHA